MSPLAHPRIARYMVQLPHEHKRGKALFRVRIRRAGPPEWVARPTHPSARLTPTGTATQYPQYVPSYD
ncbi:hypothetical protein [Streptomyces chiangmaiensis]|uniref:Uncharacterized protein n=1 Tax=Streptomyces chiangmaiensis TaxID=766497 RepID=A0ABU7FX84_9ACTN|nr:hypothetical protein [Streptomyces chiangmaiensis]MED7828168.1 hypothetical protein [Streptomyces chiangmaiensis]